MKFRKLLIGTVFLIAACSETIEEEDADITDPPTYDNQVLVPLPPTQFE